ncbi:MAG: PxKF domain-containing protein [Gemmatimonadaceae bacterium]
MTSPTSKGRVAAVCCICSSWCEQSGLTYDAASDQYNFVWKTSTTWAGTCRQFDLRLADGSVHRANFQFK